MLDSLLSKGASTRSHTSGSHLLKSGVGPEPRSVSRVSQSSAQFSELAGARTHGCRRSFGAQLTNHSGVSKASVGSYTNLASRPKTSSG